jgi:proline iminopeptidase
MRSTIHRDTATLHLDIRGQGPPVVLVHGGPGIYDYLGDSPMGRWLAEQYAVVGYDQRGCRHSVSEGPFTVNANVADLEAIRAHLRIERLTLVGHSWGGLLSLCYAADYPERVSGLVLIGSVGPRKGWEPAFWDALGRRHTDRQRRLLADVDARIARTRDRDRRGELYRQRYNIALPSYLAPVHRDLAPEIEWFSRLVGVTTMADMHRTRYADRAWEAGFVRVTAPVTVIHGRQDPVPWSVVDDLREVLPACRVVPLDDCGHFPWLEVPERFRPVLEAALELSR